MNASKTAGFISIAVFCVLMIFNIISMQPDPIGLIGAIIAIILVSVVWGYINNAFGEVSVVGWGSAILVAALVMCSGGDLIGKMLAKAPPVAVVTIENNTTYVEAPTDIEDPALKDYETEKMGFEEGWIGNALGGTYLLFAFGFALSQLLNIYIRRAGMALLSIPVELVTFVIGAVIIAQVLLPTRFADPATVEAENNAIIMGAIGPFVWSMFLQLMSFGSGKASKYGGSLGGAGVFLGIAIVVFAYPITAGIFQLFDFDLFKTMFMSHDLVNSAITLQRWTELYIMGKFVGMFLPPTLKFVVMLIIAAFKKLLGF